MNWLSRTSLLLGLAGLTMAGSLPAGAQERQREIPASANLRAIDDRVALAIRDDADGRIEDFYKSRGYRPLWVSNGTLNGAASHFLEIADNAQLDGLDPDRFDLVKLRKLLGRASDRDPEALAEAELKLSREFARLVQDMRRPIADMLYAEDEVRPLQMRQDQVLHRAARAGSFPEYVASMGWMHPLYAGLRRQLAATQAGTDLPPVEVPSGSVMRAGDSGKAVALLRQRLGLRPGVRFDEEVVQAVRSFQQARGLAADGVAGPRTLVAMNRALGGRPAEFVQTLRVNLERARLLPDAYTRHVVVNSAAAHLTYYDEGERQGAMKVVVGTPETPTPMMAGLIRFGTLNPYWNLPADLAASIIAPSVLAGHSLEAMGYEVLSGWTRDAEVIDPARVDWRAVAAGDTIVRVRQLPSARNSMGDVKFMFPNELGIFLHDTPSRDLFGKQSRQFSNGCVRLEDADRLGEWLFGERLEAETDEPEQHQRLPTPIPVYLTYLTAVPAGPDLAYYPDVYDWDVNTAAQLASK